MLTIKFSAVCFLALTKPIRGGNVSTSFSSLSRLTCFGLNSQDGQIRSRNVLSSSDYGEIQCTAVLALLAIDPDVAAENFEEESYWACEDENKMMYRLPDSALALNKSAEQLVSGKTQIVLSQAAFDMGDSEREPSVLLSPHASIVVQNDSTNGRGLTSRTGTNSLLVVRCSSADGSPSRSASQISDDVFGGQGDLHNLASQMDACSGGVLKFESADGHDAIVNGVVDIEISQSTSEVSSTNVQNYCLAELQAVVGSSASWDHIYLVIPSNVDFGRAAAFAYINHRLSVYKDVNGSYLTVMMHEIGHNLGMYHSGERSGYDDHTCMMGNPEFGDDTPLMCFNGQKSWFLGWYSDRHVSVTPESSSWTGTLVGVDDYVSGRSSTSQESVVIRVTGSTDLYVMYNKAQGVNAEVQENANQVTVVEGSIDSNVAAESTMLRSLRSGEAYRINNYAGPNRDLVIGVCSLGSSADVIIYIDGVNNVECAGESDPCFEEDDGGNQDDGNDDGGGGWFCFPGDAEVIVKGRGSVPMNHLSIGDRVKVADGSFEPIYSFTKRDHDNWVEYLQIFFADSDRPLELTPNHMVFVNKEDGTRAMEGKNVAIGDSLVLQDGVLSEVVSIDYEWKRGFYAPMTYSGTIVVNQVKASTFATTTVGPLSVDSPWLQSMYWLSQSHHRMLCRVNWGTCQQESYSEEGMSRIVEWSLFQYQCFNGLSTAAQILVGLPVLLALGLMAAVEKCSVLTALLILCCCKVYRSRQKNK